MSFFPRIHTANRLFLLLSLLLILTDGLFVWINRHADQVQLHRQLHEESLHLRDLFDTQLTATATRMQQTAAYIALDQHVQQMFLKGRQAVEAEGGGSGGVKAAEVRRKLLQELQGPWQQMQEAYDTRQLHFEFGDQVTSFLRLHAPDEYGDSLGSVRYMIRDALRLRQPLMGFETGRNVSGVRGVVPVFAHNNGNQPVFVGVLEAGTSFSVMLNQIEAATGAHLAVLLRRAELQNALFAERFHALESTGEFSGDWFIEATSAAEAKTLLALPEVQRSLANIDVATLQRDKATYALFTFPLRDYLGGVDPKRPDVGAVMAWRDISSEVAQQRKTLLVNLTYAFGAFLLIEVLLYSGIRFTTRRLSFIIERQTDELRTLAIHDRLTGLYNRYYLDEAFGRECARALRYREPLSIAILDLDHFKRVNDEHGHLVGDRVLSDFAALISRRLRAADLIFRYGGEEFLILLVNTPCEHAIDACEHIRTSLMATSLGDLPTGSLTVSAGLTTMSVDEHCELGVLLKRADDALYRAKELGRNRVEISNRNQE